MKLDDIINDEYLENDLPDLLIKESGHIREILNLIFSCKVVGQHLKKSFDRDKVIEALEEQGFMQEILRELMDSLIIHMIKRFEDCEIKEPKPRISEIWHLDRKVKTI